MKILFISDNPSSNTGYAKITGVWAKYFKSMGHEVLIMGSGPPGMRIPFQETNWEGCRRWVVPGYGNAENVRWFLANESPDAIVVSADPRFFDYLFKLDNEIRKVCPLVFYHLWDDLPFPDYNLPYYASCDHIIAGSQFTYDLLTSRNEINSDTVDYVPIGFDPQIYKPLSVDEKAEFRKDFNTFTQNKYVNTRFIVGVIGRHSERKQLLTIMDTFAKWQEDKDDVLLFVHSPGEDAGRSLEYAMKMRFNQHKIVLSNSAPNRQGDDLINKFYNLFDVLINRSTAEGFGMPIAEAMLAGIPCIAVANPGPVGLITPETGWLLDADITPLVGNTITPYIQLRYVTDEKFVAALDEAYYNKALLKGKAAKCRARIVENFSLKQMVEGVDASVQKALKNWKPYLEYTVFTYPSKPEIDVINE